MDMNEFISALGGTPPVANTEPTPPAGGEPTPPAGGEPTPPVAGAPSQTEPNANPTGVPGEPTPAAGEPTPASNPNPTPPSYDKNAQAFAAMRVQNKQMNDLLKGIGDMLGVQDQNPEGLLIALQQKMTTAQAQKQGVDPAILQEINQLKAANAQAELNETRRQAYLGFQRVKDSFKLDDNALNAFAEELIAEGSNPFETRVNLMSAYIEKHFNDIITSAEQRGAQAEAERASKAANHSSTPNNTNGQPAGEPQKINSVKDLNNWLEQNGANK